MRYFFTKNYHSPLNICRLLDFYDFDEWSKYTNNQIKKEGRKMKVKLNIDPGLPEEKAEFWLKKMTDKVRKITKELKEEQDFLWGYQDGDAYAIKFSQIFAIQVENQKTLICTEHDSYIFRGRLYQVKEVLPGEFIAASRGTIINYHFIDHLEVISTGNIDAVLKNGLRIQISRRKIKDLKERLGL